MSIIKRNAPQLHNLPSIFNDFVTKDLWNWDVENHSSTGTTIPGVNIRENSESFVVEMAAPGMNKEDFRIELNGNNLIITSEKNMDQETKEGERYTRKEFSYQSFSRAFTLAKDVVDADKIAAKYENGILQLLIPKKEEVKQKGPRTIQIS